MIISYIFFNIVNVILQTVKSILTIKGNKYVASIANAVAYGLYTYLLILIASDINLWVKIFGCAGANLIGVFVVKFFEERKEKEKLWKVEATLPIKGIETTSKILEEIENANLSYSVIPLNKNYHVYYFYCNTKKDSSAAKAIVEKFNGKYFVSESKVL